MCCVHVRDTSIRREVFVSSVNNCKGTLLLFEQFAELNLLVRRSLNYPICSSQTIDICTIKVTSYWGILRSALCQTVLT